MNKKEAHKILVHFQTWRRGAEIVQPDPTIIGEALDVAIEALEKPKYRVYSQITSNRYIADGPNGYEFSGTLPECNAYIQLKTQGILED